MSEDGLLGEGLVELYRVGSGAPLRSQQTVGGTYVFDAVPTGKFQLRFVKDGVEQWWPFESDRSRAEVLPMTAGAGGRAALNANFTVPVLESAPGEHLSITGTAEVGATLGLSLAAPDPFGNPGLRGSEELSSISWLLDGVPMTGQHGPSLVVPPGAEGGEISATAMFSQLVGFFATAVVAPAIGPVTASALPALSPAPTPTIVGEPQVGVQLQAVIGTWGPGATTRVVQWNRDGIAIAGANAARYTPKGTDAGSVLSVTVTASKAGYQTASRTSAATEVVGETAFTTVPVPVLAPARVGSAPRVGDAIRVAHGNWAPNPEGFSYQWLRDGVPIDGATGSTLTITVDDLGATLTAQVTGTRLGYVTETRESLPSGVVAEGVFTGRPVIVPAPQVGVTSSVDLAGIVPVADEVVEIRWMRGSTTLATGPSYTPTASDAGRNLRVVVVVTKAGYLEGERPSLAVTVLP